MTLLSFPGDSLLPGKMRKLRRGGPFRGRTRYRVPRAADVPDTGQRPGQRRP